VVVCVGRTIHVSDKTWIELSKLKIEVRSELVKQYGKRRISFSDVIEYLIEFYRKNKTS
jgi:hypothetical protein